MDATRSLAPDPRAPAGDEPPSPAAALEPAIEQALLGLGHAEMSALLQELSQQSLQTGFSWERRDGGYDPLPMQLRPRVWTVKQAEFVQAACLDVQGGLSQLLGAWLADPSAREVLPLEPYEEERLRALAPHAPAGEQLFSRLDALIDTTHPRWDGTLAFLEPNVVGVGGARYTAVGEQLWARVVQPRLGGLPVLPPVDARDLMLHCLLDRARALRLPELPGIALVEDLRDPFGTNELRLIAEHFRERGVPAHHVDVRSLEWRRDALFADGHPVELVYRFPELRELPELDDGKSLEPLWRAFREGRVVSTLSGDFDHKSSFELFTSERFAPLFTEAQRRTFRRHVLWTRLVRDARVEGPAGADIDLADHIRRNRESLVLKPNRSYGGQGVAIGPELTPADWERRLDAALAEPGAWVVQAYRALPMARFPAWGEAGWEWQDLLMVCGFFATPRGVASMGRVSRAKVVNLSQRGASMVAQVRTPG